jgi:hypothetical protein
VRLPGIDAHNRDAEFAQAKADRRRHAPRLDHRPLDRAISLQRFGYRFRRAVHLLGRNLPAISSTMQTCVLSIDRSSPA